MGIGGSIVVIVIVWWLAFQAMLPIGVKNAAEAGMELSGDPGAPVRAGLFRKGVWAMLIALPIWFGIFSLVHWSGLKMSDLPSIFDEN